MGVPCRDLCSVVGASHAHLAMVCDGALSRNGATPHPGGLAGSGNLERAPCGARLTDALQYVACLGCGPCLIEYVGVAPFSVGRTGAGLDRSNTHERGGVAPVLVARHVADGRLVALLATGVGVVRVGCSLRDGWIAMRIMAS